MNELTNVTTGEVRFSYAHLFKPYAAMPGQEEKYSVTILVPKTDMDTMGRINAAIEAAKQKGTADKWLKPSSMNGFTERKVKNNGRWNI